MCNLYSMTSTREAIRALFGAARDQTGNQPPPQAVFPDQTAPVILAESSGERVMRAMRWGFPPPQPGGRPVTNIRNTASPFWRGWLRREFRCLVPATSFCEYDEAHAKRPTWFALGPARPPFAFAGLWRPWTGRRKGEDGEHALFAFLTTDANDLVRPVHARAMPVVLTEPAEWDAWLTAETATALALQRALPAGRLEIIAAGQRYDAPEAAT